MRVKQVIGAAAIVAVLAGCGQEREEQPTTAPTPTGAIPSPKAPARPAKAGAAGAAQQGQEQVAEAAAQPPAPPLPQIVDLTTSLEELGAHALVVAREEVARGDLPQGIAIVDRHRFLYEAWLPLMQERQAYLQSIQDARKEVVQRELRAAKTTADHERRLAESDASYQAKIRDEQDKRIPILPE